MRMLQSILYCHSYVTTEVTEMWGRDNLLNRTAYATSDILQFQASLYFPL